MVEVKPTLTDDQIMRFISEGFVLLEGVIPDEINRLIPKVESQLPREFRDSREFVHGMLLHPEVAGVARSLLGPDMLIPDAADVALSKEPHTGQTWHTDGLPEESYGIHHLQCFYYPEAVGPEDGPTVLLPGSHFRLVDREAIAHYGDIVGQIPLVVPAGTVAITQYGLWHRAGPKLNAKPRQMIKLSYFRTGPPQRDWVIDSEEIPEFAKQATHPYTSEIEGYRDTARCRHTWDWLCGLERSSDISRSGKMFHPPRQLQMVDG